MNDFRSSYQRNGRYDYGPMREDHKDDYMVALGKGWLNSYIGLPMLGVGLILISCISKDFLSATIPFTTKYGGKVSEETIIFLYKAFSAAPLIIGSAALYKGTVNIGDKLLGRNKK